MDCDCLIHPFQNDPGTSQAQRVMDDLLGGAAKIDARTMADLLDYFVQMSRHINFYGPDLSKSDWQPFFKKSIPFTLASVVRFPLADTSSNLGLYQAIYDRKPSSTGLQLVAHAVFCRLINPVNTWQQTLQDSGLPVAGVMDSLIKNKLAAPLKQFIRYTNAAVQSYQVARIDFQSLASNPVWGLDARDLSDTDTSFSAGTASARQRMDNLYGGFSSLTSVFSDAVKTLALAAGKSLEASFIPLKEDLQKRHSPHLALLFVFLNMFRQLQDDLNQYSKRHLDYFYRDILQFKAAAAVPDKANVLFEIQKALKSYLVKKGLRVKAGKDIKKQEMLFSLDDDIVVTQTSIADKRTLFLNNQEMLAQTYVEGVYMAPVAAMADGVAIDFADDPKNFPTVGGHLSKYADPETRLLKPYPNARLGFVLASPVLLMQTGSTRTITIDLPCRLSESLCSDLQLVVSENPNDCCGSSGHSTTETVTYPSLYKASAFFTAVNTVLNQTYYYINEDIIKAALKQGISASLADWLREKFLTDTEEAKCYCPVKKRKFENTVMTFPADIAGQSAGEQQILGALIKPRKLFSLQLSGEKDWIDQATIDELQLAPPDAPGTIPFEFKLHLKLTLGPDQEGVTFYNEKNLGEKLGTTQPLIKVLLDDKIKMKDIPFAQIVTPPESAKACCEQDSNCCLLTGRPGGDVSLYHFFRNVSVKKADETNLDNPVIAVQVCGLKNFIVQNDEAVMNINGPIYPFGTRPDIIDFNVTDGQIKYYLTRATITDAMAGGLTAPGAASLGAYITGTGNFPIPGTMVDVDAFLATVPGLTPADINLLHHLFATKSYSNKNLVGPNFYVGSNEIFSKTWSEVFVNLNWKDKPTNFRDYYQAYMAMKDENPPNEKLFGLDDQKFEINLSVLDAGAWKNELLHPNPGPPPFPIAEEATVRNPATGTNNRRLFPKTSTASFCAAGPTFDQSIHLRKEFFPATAKTQPSAVTPVKYDNSSRNGFLKINLQNQDFLHSDYAYVLARQMNAAAMLKILDKDNNPTKVEDAIYYDSNNRGLVVFNSNEIKDDLNTGLGLSQSINQDVNGPNRIRDLADAPGNNQPIPAADSNTIRAIVGNGLTGLSAKTNILAGKLQDVVDKLKPDANFQAIIPKEPWTPVISSMSIDYTASESISGVSLIHLYPFDNTFKTEELMLQPTLFPTICDEGTLFLGLKDLVPGDNLNLLFQMAEATSDSESDPETVFWYYLDGNAWKPLRNGFEVLNDGTKYLTRTGILKLALPANMNKDNTVMPADLYWIKAGIPKNSGAVSETLAILTQAVEVTFINDTANDKKRLGTALPGGSISKLEIADASVKTVSQPYEAFGGLVPEDQQQFYVRVSETLRHKGRAIQAFDYERLVLQAFPQLFKAKCINHSLALNAHEYKNDFPYAGGYILMAVIPDLNQLKAGNSFQPKVPVSILEDVDTFIRKRCSPFVRFRAMNPRYEEIRFCLKIRLQKGKDENYFREQVKKDLREFLAPWAVGEYDKLTFGQCVYRSDVIRFLETRDYMDFISDLTMNNAAGTADPLSPKICPDSPRSILIAGEIEVCIDEPDCPQWGPYTACDQQRITSCGTSPVRIANYCK